jgi:alcohol dehydrogenase
MDSPGLNLAAAGLNSADAHAGVLAAFDFAPRTRVVYGPGSIARLGELARSLACSRVLLVTDPGLEAVGHPRRACAVLRSAGLEVFVFDGVEENPTTRHVAACVQYAGDKEIDLIVAVGGGSAMDCAKGTNFLLTNGGAMSDYKGYGRAALPMLPSIGVPTTAGTGSEAQSYALIADEVTHLKMACGDKKAAFRVAVLDPELTVSQPAKVTAVTGVDAVAHVIESFVCTRRNPLSQAFARAAWRLLEPNLERVLRRPDDLEARGAMQLGAHFAGASIEYSMLGSCHACANPLSAHYGMTHGVAIGILLPHVILFNAPEVEPLYAELTREAKLPTDYASTPAKALARRVGELVQAADLPRNLTACGVSASILPLLAEEANQQWTARFNPRPVGELDLLGIYEAAL